MAALLLLLASVISPQYDLVSSDETPITPASSYPVVPQGYSVAQAISRSVNLNNNQQVQQVKQTQFTRTRFHRTK